MRRNKCIALLLIVTLIVGLFQNIDLSYDTNSLLKPNYTVNVSDDLSDAVTCTNSQLNKFVDSITYSEKNENSIKATVRKCVPRYAYMGIDYTAIEDEEVGVVIENDVEYNLENGTIEVDVNCITDNTNEVIENAEVFGNIATDGDYIIGTYEYNGVMFDLGEIMGAIENADGIEDCLLTGIVVGAIIGAAIGATIGGAVSYVKYKELNWRYVVGGSVIGATFGAVAGWGVGYFAASSTAVSQCASVSKCLKSKKAFGFTKTVLGHTERPYRNSTLLVKEIMQSATGIVDKSAANCYKWAVPGVYNKTKGVWELVVNTKTKTVVHLLFRK